MPTSLDMHVRCRRMGVYVVSIKRKLLHGTERYLSGAIFRGGGATCDIHPPDLSFDSSPVILRRYLEEKKKKTILGKALLLYVHVSKHLCMLTYSIPLAVAVRTGRNL